MCCRRFQWGKANPYALNHHHHENMNGQSALRRKEKGKSVHILHQIFLTVFTSLPRLIGILC